MVTLFMHCKANEKIFGYSIKLQARLIYYINVIFVFLSYEAIEKNFRYLKTEKNVMLISFIMLPRSINVARLNNLWLQLIIYLRNMLWLHIWSARVCALVRVQNTNMPGTAGKAQASAVKANRQAMLILHWNWRLCFYCNYCLMQSHWMAYRKG